MYMNRKGVQFAHKDTWNLDYVLGKVIASGLTKYYQVMQERLDNDLPVGVPGNFAKWDEKTQEHDTDIEAWMKTLEVMIYAFEDKEPYSNKYNFDIEWVFDDIPDMEGCKVTKTRVTNEEEYERYKKDCDLHEDKVQKGLDLFAKYYKNLWW